MSDAAGEDDEQTRMTLFEHLAELRSRLLKVIIAVLLGATLAWIFYDWIFDFLTEPLCDTLPRRECRLVITDPLQGFSTRLKVSGYGGITLAMPVILWQLWRFISPGLHRHERRYAIPFVCSSLVLFVLGAGLAYWTLPRALEFLINIGGDLNPFFTPDKYISLITYMMLAFGIGFEFPILLIFLQMAGIVTPEKLGKWRAYAVIAVFVIVAVITPSGDPISLTVLAIPMCVFYEISILIGRLLRRRKAKAAADV